MSFRDPDRERYHYWSGLPYDLSFANSSRGFGTWKRWCMCVSIHPIILPIPQRHALGEHAPCVAGGPGPPQLRGMVGMHMCG